MKTNSLVLSLDSALVKHRILIVDDEAMNRALMEALFVTNSSYELEFALSGAEAMKVALDRKIDLILLDATLPDIDGYTVCRRLKSDRQTERIPIILIAAGSSAVDRGKGIEAGAEDILGKPFHRAELLLRVGSLLKIKSLHDQLDEVEAVILGLTRIMEAKDKYTEAHTLRVAAHAVSIGEELGMSEEDRRLLHRAALLHDIGKIGISELILNKPGQLTPEEQRLIRQQSDISASICAPMRSTPQILPIIRHIHERVDGEGYPDHLIGDQIPLGARIIAVADAYDAMTSQRPYRPALSPAKARIQLKHGAGQQWDARIVETLLTLLEKANSEQTFALVA